MPAFASKGHLIRSFNKLGDLLLSFGKQNKKPHAEQKATYSYEQAVLEPAYVQKLENPPKRPPTPTTNTVKKVRDKNEVTWVLAEDGTPISAEAILGKDFGGSKRSSVEAKAQARAGGDARLDTDQGGHIIGHRFMGDQGTKNLFPQNANLNRSAYKTMENEWADWIDEGFEIRLKVELDPPGAARPDNIKARYEVIDPHTKNRVFRREHDFQNQTGENFSRIQKKDMRSFRS